MELIPITDIKVEDRQRKDLGDLEPLAESIKRLGLIQPIVVDQDLRLVAGERRLRASKLAGLTEVPVYIKGEMSEDELTEMELEENIRRKDMTWQEKCKSIAKIHQLRWNTAAKRGDKWSYRMTGELMNMSVANVGYVLLLVKEMQDPNSQIHAIDTFTNAIKWLARRNEDQIEAELARRTKDSMKRVGETTKKTEVSLPAPNAPDVDEEGEPILDRVIPLSKMLIHGDCLNVLKEMEPNSVDHCISDPPYAIDMAMLSQENTGMDVSRVEEEHDVSQNLDLLRDAIPLITKVVRPHGFVCLWCDVMNWQFLYDTLSNSGLLVQRWPIIWYKTHQCMNQAASYNFTKNYEMCIVARMPSATLSEKSDTSFISASKEKSVSNPFAKPYEVWSFLIKHVSRPGQIILDPFCGEGSSLKTFAQHWRVFVGIECNEKHYNVALNTMKETLDLLYRKPSYV